MNPGKHPRLKLEPMVEVEEGQNTALYRKSSIMSYLTKEGAPHREIVQRCMCIYRGLGDYVPFFPSGFSMDHILVHSFIDLLFTQ